MKLDLAQYSDYEKYLRLIIDLLINNQLMNREKINDLTVNYQNLTPDDLKNVMEEYGRSFVSLPRDFLENTYWYPLVNEEKTWSIDVPLWTKEEGKSDLTLSLILQDTRSGVNCTITDLHVL